MGVGRPAAFQKKSPGTIRAAYKRKTAVIAIDALGSEHRQTALRLGLGRLVLQNVPVFGEQAASHADDIGGDPILRFSSVHKSAVDDHAIAFGDDGAPLISKGRRRAPDQIEQAVASGFECALCWM
jgi:hypothetical protein